MRDLHALACGELNYIRPDSLAHGHIGVDDSPDVIEFLDFVDRGFFSLSAFSESLDLLRCRADDVSRITGAAGLNLDRDSGELEGFAQKLEVNGLGDFTLGDDEKRIAGPGAGLSRGRGRLARGSAPSFLATRVWVHRYSLIHLRLFRQGLHGGKAAEQALGNKGHGTVTASEISSHQ